MSKNCLFFVVNLWSLKILRVLTKEPRKIIGVLFNNTQVTISATLHYFMSQMNCQATSTKWMKIWRMNSSEKFIQFLQVMYENGAVSFDGLYSQLNLRPWPQRKRNFPAVLIRLFCNCFEWLKTSVLCWRLYLRREQTLHPSTRAQLNLNAEKIDAKSTKKRILSLALKDIYFYCLPDLSFFIGPWTGL